MVKRKIKTGKKRNPEFADAEESDDIVESDGGGEVGTSVAKKKKNKRKAEVPDSSAVTSASGAPTKKKKKARKAAAADGELAGDLTELLQSLAQEAGEAGEEWAVEADPGDADKLLAAEEPGEVLETSEEERILKEWRPKKKLVERKVAKPAGEVVSKKEKVLDKDKPTVSKVCLDGLPWSVDEETLRKDFGKFGEIDKLFFKKDAQGRAAGEATIFYKSEEVAQKVLLLDGIDYKGRVIKVKRREPRNRSGFRSRASMAGRRHNKEDSTKDEADGE